MEDLSVWNCTDMYASLQKKKGLYMVYKGHYWTLNYFKMKFYRKDNYFTKHNTHYIA